MFNLASKYSFSLDKNTEKVIQLFLLLYNLEKYVNGAIIQMSRLDRTRKVIRKDIQQPLKVKGKRDFQLTYLANDTHFYFICIDKVHKLLSRLSDELNDADIKNLAVKLEKYFDIKTIRGHLEHIDARCLGFISKRDEKKKIKKPISDFGNFFDENFSFDGKKFPSDIGSMSELKKAYVDLIEVINKKYASQDPNFIRRQQSEDVYKKIMQKLRKAGFLKVRTQ